MAPDISGARSASGAVEELVALQQSNGDAGGIGDVAGRLDDATHGTVQVEPSARNRTLQIHDVGKTFTTDATLLNGKCARQELLKSFATDAGGSIHTDALQPSSLWRASGPNHSGSWHSKFLIAGIDCQYHSSTHHHGINTRSTFEESGESSIHDWCARPVNAHSQFFRASMIDKASAGTIPALTEWRRLQ